MDKPQKLSKNCLNLLHECTLKTLPTDFNQVKSLITEKLENKH